MPFDRDVRPFDDRSAQYEEGWRGQLHREIVDRALDAATRVDRSPRRVLDVGCGTGQLLRLLAERSPGTQELAGVDPAPRMIEVASSTATDDRVSFSIGTAERLPYPNSRFELVVSTTSFDHWEDQARGLAECARVLTPGGYLVLTDLFSLCLVPTLVGIHGRRARTRRRVQRLLSEAGFTSITWHRGYALIINTVVASHHSPDAH